MSAREVGSVAETYADATGYLNQFPIQWNSFYLSCYIGNLYRAKLVIAYGCHHVILTCGNHVNG